MFSVLRVCVEGWRAWDLGFEFRTYDGSNVQHFSELLQLTISIENIRSLGCGRGCQFANS